MIRGLPSVGRDPRVLLCLAIVWCVGLGHILLLPPWEGYDEVAHWSYIEQLADTGRAPTAHDALSSNLLDYTGPMPYGLFLNGNSRWPSYAAFRTSPLSLGPGPTRFAAGSWPNWESQHPPLFYALALPVFEVSRSLGWKWHLLILRLFCWTIAFAGLVVASRAESRDTDSTAPVGLMVAVWPLLFPEFFPEMARLGNDSLCLFLASCVWVLLLGVRSQPRARWRSPLIGILLGLGLLTKAFFIPLSLGSLLLLFVFVRTSGWRHAIVHTALAGASCVAIGLWWYVGQVVSGSGFGTGNEFNEAAMSFGAQHFISNFSAIAFAKGLFGIILTSLWAGTWSFAVWPAWTTLPLLALPGVPLARWLIRVRQGEIAILAPLFLVVPMLTGLVLHEGAWVALGHTSPGTPGWYLHILAGPLAYGLAHGWRRGRLNQIFVGLTATATAILWGSQVAVFSGCTEPDATGHLAARAWACIADWPTLSRLGFPTASAATLIAALGLGLLAWSQRGQSVRNDPGRRSFPIPPIGVPSRRAIARESGEF